VRGCWRLASIAAAVLSTDHSGGWSLTRCLGDSDARFDDDSNDRFDDSAEDSDDRFDDSAEDSDDSSDDSAEDSDDSSDDSAEDSYDSAEDYDDSFDEDRLPTARWRVVV